MEIIMKIGAPKEIFEGENRVALTPQSAVQLKKLGYTCLIESGAGLPARFSDADYQKEGVEVVSSASELWSNSDIVVKVRVPQESEIELGHEGQTLISSIIQPKMNRCLRN